MNPRNTLSVVWAAWKRIGRFVGDLIARVVLTVFYFTVFVPFGLVTRLTGRRGEKSRLSHASWIGRNQEKDDLRKAHRLY